MGKYRNHDLFLGILCKPFCYAVTLFFFSHKMHVFFLQKQELFFLFQVVSTCFVGTNMFNIPLQVPPYLILYTVKSY